MQWLLPEYFADILPPEAKRLESLRRKVLDLFASYGFELVMPPLIEYLDSLLTGSARDLDLKTFKLVDQLSGKMMGLRADITPQIVRIDSQLLNDDGITRLCYCGVVAHTRPSNLKSGRELQQIGAEIYGAPNRDADGAIIQLAAKALNLVGLQIARIDLNHVGIFNALCHKAQLNPELKNQLMHFLRLKDAPALFEATQNCPQKEAFRALVNLYGESQDVLNRARLIFQPLALPELNQALDDLEWIVQTYAHLPFSIDLADLVGYHYHTGLSFSAYSDKTPNALAHGGRYDGAGAPFGRVRAATGFSMDLRQLVCALPQNDQQEELPIWVCSNSADNAQKTLPQALDFWRNQKNRMVIETLENETIPSNADCLIWQNGNWILQKANQQLNQKSNGEGF